MNLKKLFIILSFLFTTTMVLGQGFSYTFTDPCTFKQKQIYISEHNSDNDQEKKYIIKTIEGAELINYCKKEIGCSTN